MKQSSKNFNSIQDVHFQDYSRMRGKKGLPALKSVTHILQFLIFKTFSESLNIALIKMFTILMMSAKMNTLSLLKAKVFWKKGYDVIVSVHAVTNNVLSRDSNYTVDVVW